MIRLFISQLDHYLQTKHQTSVLH